MKTIELTTQEVLEVEGGRAPGDPYICVYPESPVIIICFPQPVPVAS